MIFERIFRLRSRSFCLKISRASACPVQGFCMRPRKILAYQIPPCSAENHESLWRSQRVKSRSEHQEKAQSHVISARKTVRIAIHRMIHERENVWSCMENRVFFVITWKSTWHGRHCATVGRIFSKFRSIFSISRASLARIFRIFSRHHDFHHSKARVASSHHIFSWPFYPPSKNSFS